MSNSDAETRSPLVWVVGDSMLDVTVTAPQYRRTPEHAQVPIVPAVDLDTADTALGGAANLAANLAALGCRVTLFGRVGASDEAGYVLNQKLGAYGIRNYLRSGNATTVRARYYEADRLIVRLDRDSDDRPVVPVEAELPTESPDAVVLTDYGRGVLDAYAVRKWVALTQERSISLFFDPKIGRSAVWAGAREIVFVANWAEAVDAVANYAEGAWDDPCNDATLDLMAGVLLIRLPYSTVVIKRGVHGSVIYTPQGKLGTIPAIHPQRLFDVQGAGDSYLAGLVAARCRNAEWLDAGLYASAVAGVAVGKPGTAVVTMAEARERIKGQIGASRGVLTAKEAYTLSARLRALDMTVGYASGCWDVRLHAGHLQLLAEAQLECDFLFVGVDSDRRVRALKGPTRPILSEEERAAQVATIQGVGAAFVFDTVEQYPRDVITALNPHVLVKGGDYRERGVPEADVLLAAGGRLAIVDSVPGCSTTALIESIMRAKGEAAE